jgi:hypothetical protein
MRNDEDDGGRVVVMVVVVEIQKVFGQIVGG